MKKTVVIKYNLKDRGREFRGRDRNFNIAAIVKAINSEECQERVRKRDMLGFYGHWPRVKLGMNPCEGGFDKGRPAIVEPALVTTMLKAYPDGTIEHQAEFLDTDSGIVASKLYDSQVGGFSSAIDQRKPEFCGFDYVLEPNYSTNRGWTLDSVDGVDVDAEIQNEQLKGALSLLERRDSELKMANETIEHLTEENEELRSIAASGRSLDSVYDPNCGGFSVSIRAKDQFEDDVRAFSGTKNLPRFDGEKGKEKTFDSVSDVHPLYGRILGLS